MLCQKCNGEIMDGAAFCPWCGKKVKDESIKRRRVRANGQGTVYRLPSGKWIAKKVLGYELIPGSNPPKKRAIVVTRSDFTRKVDALSFLPILGTEADTRNIKHGCKMPSEPEDKTTITLKELYDLWFPTHRAGKSTMGNYRAGFKVFQNVWGVPMKYQDIDDLQECMDTCGKGIRTREDGKKALGLVYKYGMPRGYVPSNAAGKPNLAEFLIVGGGERGHKDGLPEEELEKVRRSVGTVPYADYILANCYLGFRPSAFIALTGADYNPKEKAFVGGIKTEAGIGRTVTVSPKIQSIIDARIAVSGDGPVFSYLEDGRPLTLEKYREVFYTALEMCGIENPITVANGIEWHKYTPHSCRHTFATLMKRVEAPDKDKLALIGHTDPEMLRYYQDVSYTDLRHITDAL